MNASEYEIVTSKSANSVFASKQGFASENVLVGNQSKWKGQSAFVHQIDVAIRSDSDIIMVECKHWKDKVIKAEHVLTFIARINDIRPTLKQTLHPVIVTCNRFQSGCYTLAKFYGIDLEIILSPERFAFSYKGMRFVGIGTGMLQMEGNPPTVVEGAVNDLATAFKQG